MLNPDPKKFNIRFRHGKPILVDRAIYRWRKRRNRALAALRATLEAEQDAIEAQGPKIRNIFL